MKHLLIALSLVVFGTSACAKEEKPLPPVVVTAPVLPAEDAAKPKTKRVCVMQKDAKTGKDKEVCRTVKVHKKLEGTKIEDAKKDAKK